MALGVVGFSDVRGRMKNALIAFSTVIEDGSHSPYGQFSASSQLPDYVDQAISFFCLPRWQCSRVETPYLKIQEAIKPEWTKMAPYRWCAVPDCVLRIEKENRVATFSSKGAQLESWRKATGLQLSNKLRICFKHFEDDLVVRGRTVCGKFYSYKHWRLQQNFILSKHSGK